MWTLLTEVNPKNSAFQWSFLFFFCSQVHMLIFLNWDSGSLYESCCLQVFVESPELLLSPSLSGPYLSSQVHVQRSLNVKEQNAPCLVYFGSLRQYPLLLFSTVFPISKIRYYITQPGYSLFCNILTYIKMFSRQHIIKGTHKLVGSYFITKFVKG